MCMKILWYMMVIIFRTTFCMQKIYVANDKPALKLQLVLDLWLYVED